MNKDQKNEKNNEKIEKNSAYKTDGKLPHFLIIK